MKRRSSRRRRPAPNRAPLIQQFTKQARPLLRAELIFARNVCQLNREELRKVNEDAQKMLDEVVDEARRRPVPARVQSAAGQGTRAEQSRCPAASSGWCRRGHEERPDAGAMVALRSRAQKRDENRKRMTIRYFVDAIDRELYLTPEQRERLEDSFKAKWDSDLDAVSRKPPVRQPVLSR